MPSNTARHYQKKTNNVKKKPHTGTIVIFLAVFVLLISLAVYVGNHMEFTPDGIKFTFREERAEQESITPVTAPVSDEESALFAPKVKRQYSIAYNALPESGIPSLNGVYIDITAPEKELTDTIMQIADKGITTAVIDLKSLEGYLCFDSICVLAENKFDGSAKLENFIKLCTRKNIKVVGVMHCFADNRIPRKDSSYAVCTESGALYIDGEYNTWLDPENEAVRTYIIEAAAQAAALGVREIILDDFCFPYSGNVSALPVSDVDRTELIMSMLEQIREKVDVTVRLGMYIYDDVAGEGFGEGKGLDLARINNACDHIYMHTSALSEAIKFHGSIANLIPAAAAKLCIELDGEYLSDGYYIERYKQQAYDSIGSEEE